jgi:hypothetical protein
LNPKISAHTFEKAVNKKHTPDEERAVRDFHIEEETVPPHGHRGVPPEVGFDDLG